MRGEGEPGEIEAEARGQDKDLSRARGFPGPQGQPAHSPHAGPEYQRVASSARSTGAVCPGGDNQRPVEQPEERGNQVLPGEDLGGPSLHLIAEHFGMKRQPVAPGRSPAPGRGTATAADSPLLPLRAPRAPCRRAVRQTSVPRSCGIRARAIGTTAHAPDHLAAVARPNVRPVAKRYPGCRRMRKLQAKTSAARTGVARKMSSRANREKVSRRKSTATREAASSPGIGDPQISRPKW